MGRAERPIACFARCPGKWALGDPDWSRGRRGGMVMLKRCSLGANCGKMPTSGLIWGAGQGARHAVSQTMRPTQATRSAAMRPGAACGTVHHVAVRAGFPRHRLFPRAVLLRASYQASAIPGAERPLPFPYAAAMPCVDVPLSNAGRRCALRHAKFQLLLAESAASSLM